VENRKMKLGEQFVDPLLQDLIGHHVRPYLAALGRVSHKVELGLAPKSYECFTLSWQQRRRYSTKKDDHRDEKWRVHR
jgi:hypothetical protein